MSKQIFWTFGRFQPPTKGHRILIESLHNETLKKENTWSIAIVFFSSKSNKPITPKVKSNHQKQFDKGNLIL